MNGQQTSIPGVNPSTFSPSMMKITIAVIVTAACITTSVRAATSLCPSWEDAIFLNRKCFKMFWNTGLDWHQAQSACKNQSGIPTARLAEPRTREEVDLVATMSAITKANVWIGAYTDSTTQQLRFASDDALMDHFGYRDPDDPPNSAASCVRIRGKYPDMRDVDCTRKDLVYLHLCQRDASETEKYIIPISVISHYSSPFIPEKSEVFLDIVPNGDTLENQGVLLIYRSSDDKDDDSIDSIMNIYHSFVDINSTSDAKTLTFPNNFTKTVEFETIHSKAVEVMTSHPMTLTLWYDADAVIVRAPLHPCLSEVWGENGQLLSTRYILASPGHSDSKQLFHLSIVSHNKGFTQVNITFPDIIGSDDCISLDSIQMCNPNEIRVVLEQYQSVNIKGTISLDETLVTTSQAVSVFITAVSHNGQSLNLNNAQQVLPYDVASLQYIALPFPSQDGTKNNIYKIVSIDDDTVVAVNERTHPLALMATSQEINLQNNLPYLTYGDKPFKIFKVFEGNTYHDGIIKDTCALPIVPDTLWESEYAISTRWMSRTDAVHLHLVLSRNTTDAFYLDDTIITLKNCSDIEGITGFVVCTQTVDQIAIASQLAIRISASVKFGAFLEWTSGNATGCQILGMNWYGDRATVISGYDKDFLFSPTTAKTTATTTSASLEATTSKSAVEIPFANQTCAMFELQFNLTHKELDDLTETIKKILILDVKKTSSYVRSKTSAKDDRPSSTSIGYGGIAFLVIILLFIVTSDAINVLKYISENRGE